MKRLLAWLPVVLTLGCGSDSGETSLVQDVGASFAPCNPAEIRYLATKHNVMTAFEPCGNNNFQHFAWSPDGRLLYFQLVLVAHVMNADAPDKAVITVPTETPIGPAAWLNASRLAIPVGPKEHDGPNRLVLFDLEQRSLFEHPLPDFTAVHAAQRGASRDQVLLLATDTHGERRIHRIDVTTGAIDQPFPFLSGPVDTFTYTPQVDALTVGQGDAVTVYIAATGETRGTFRPAQRGTVHPDGRWLALEHEGEPISIFYQRSWDELSPRARERELARAKKFEEQFSARSNFPTTVRPPTLGFVDLSTGKRAYLDSVYGRSFAWYEPTPFFGSAILWGFEGKEFKRNVFLANMHDRLRALELDRTMTGVNPMEDGEMEGFVPGILTQVAAPAEKPASEDP